MKKREKTEYEEGEKEQSVCVGSEACKTNGWFIFLGNRELILRGDGRGETEERAGYDLKAFISGQISLFCRAAVSLGKQPYRKGGNWGGYGK